MSSSANKSPKKQSNVFISNDKATITKNNLSKTITNNITSLLKYNSKNPLKQHMITLIQTMYKTRDIKNFKTAKTAMDLLTSKNDINKFQTMFTQLLKLSDEKTNKTKLKTDIKQEKQDIEIMKIVQDTEKVVLKPDVKFKKNMKAKFKKNNTIMPSYEITINRDYTEFSDVWKECKIPLYRHSRSYMEKQDKPLKLRVGVKFTAYRAKRSSENIDNVDFLHDEDEDEDEEQIISISTPIHDLIVNSKRLTKNTDKYIYILNYKHLQQIYVFIHPKQ